MTLKKFIKILRSNLEDSEKEWLTFGNEDKNFQGLEDNEIAITGEVPKEVFYMKVFKVREEDL